MLRFEKDILIYLPCYNCQKHIGETLRGIPAAYHDKAEALVVENRSEDDTAAVALAAAKDLRFPVRVIRPRENLGYAGSQKLAYSLAVKSGNVKRVIMLHGDGQYPPELLTRLEPFLAGDAAVVNGYRSKRSFPVREETPTGAYLAIKALNEVENLITGYRRTEWHSGFVMYATEFLRQVPLQRLTRTRHLDGEMLMCAGILRQKVISVPIYKRYKGCEAFAGPERRRYVWRALDCMWRCRLGYHRRVLRNETLNIDYAYDVLHETDSSRG